MENLHTATPLFSLSSVFSSFYSRYFSIYVFCISVSLYSSISVISLSPHIGKGASNGKPEQCTPPLFPSSLLSSALWENICSSTHYHHLQTCSWSFIFLICRRVVSETNHNWVKAMPFPSVVTPTHLSITQPLIYCLKLMVGDTQKWNKDRIQTHFFKFFQ